MKKRIQREALKVINMTGYDIKMYDSLGNLIKLPVTKRAYSKSDLPEMRGGTFIVIEDDLIKDVKYDDKLNFLMVTASCIGDDREGEKLYVLKDLYGTNVILAGTELLND